LPAPRACAVRGDNVVLFGLRCPAASPRINKAADQRGDTPMWIRGRRSRMRDSDDSSVGVAPGVPVMRSTLRSWNSLNPACIATLTTAMAATSVLAVVLTPSPARAAFADPHCTEANGQFVCTFPQGETDGFVPPPGFTTADVTLEGGAGGAGGRGAAGGAGGTTRGLLTLPTPAGTAMDIFVGESGQAGQCATDAAGGTGGHSTSGPDVAGGDGGNGSGAQACSGGGGGGGSFIMVSGDSPSDATPLAAAGGGGGGGGGTDDVAGGPGGVATTGLPDGGDPGHGTPHGEGGTQISGGDGANNAGTLDDGSPGNGGNGVNGPDLCAEDAYPCNDGGGGGGGGFFGGGGGGGGAGGGGGSSCLPCEGGSGSSQSAALAVTPRSHQSGPVFHEAQGPMIRMLFGTPNTGPGGQPPGGGAPGVGAPPPLPPGHGGPSSNDPNPNTNPPRLPANDFERTATANCHPQIGVCTVRPPAGPDSQFSVTARGGSSKALLFGTLMGGSRPDCPDYTELNADWVAFGFRDKLNGSTWRKTGVLTTRHTLSHAKAAALARKMQICFEAPYRFLTREGYALGGHNATFDGVLPDCAALAGHAARGMARPCVASRTVLARHGGWVVRFVFRVPANGHDPKALG
jgi:hypothetical protein